MMIAPMHPICIPIACIRSNSSSVLLLRRRYRLLSSPAFSSSSAHTHTGKACNLSSSIHANANTNITTTGKGQNKNRISFRISLSLVCGTVVWISLSMYNRAWREDKIESLPRATSEESLAKLTKQRHRTPRDILQTIQRCGLMGEAASVKEELGYIRSWHQAHGYRGGLVLRELNEPLYGMFDQYFVGEQGGELPMDELNTRECYYLYYEMLGNGQVLQQIFCRGTTLRADVGQCLKSVYLFDPELGCNIHLGFREHAERLLRDLEPLLLRSSDNRGTIEVSGHSLGGAVALIVALKLIKRGYNVTRVTTVAAPKLCDSQAVKILTPLLPDDVLRIENDNDIVTFMPPTGRHLGDKLWFTSGKRRTATFLPASSIKTHKWVDSFFINFFLFETLTGMPSSHRISNYANNFEKYFIATEK